jgi:hypothetical protein
MKRFGIVLISSFLVVSTAMAQYSLSEIDSPLNEVALPGDFIPATHFIVDADSVAPGYVYFDVQLIGFGPGQETVGYTVIMDNEGQVRFFDRAADGHYTHNFQPFDDFGLIGYDINGAISSTQYVLVDTNFVPVDTISAPQIDAHDYRIDTHEFLIGGDGNYWIEAHYDSVMDMSQYFAGAPTEFDVGANALMKLDAANHSPLWTWKSLDHLGELPFTDSYDTTSWINRTSGEQLHTNALALDLDGNLLASNRMTSCVIKLRVDPGQPDDGEVMWKIGGGPGNQFTFLGTEPDSAFDAQHDIRRWPDGHLSIYDNGKGGGVDSSIAKEFVIDEDNKTAEMVWHYHRPNMVSGYSAATGSNRRLANGNAIICWGYTTDYGITEVTRSGNIVWEIAFDSYPGYFGGYPSQYRAFKSTMFGTAYAPYVVANHGDGEAELTMNWFGHTDVDSFFVEVADAVDGVFMPLGGVDSSKVMLTGLTNGESYMVRIQAKKTDDSMSPWSRVWTFTLPIVDSVGERIVSIPGTFELGQAYPNPFNPSTIVPVHLSNAGKLEVRVFDVLGRQVAELQNGTINAGDHRFTFNAASLSSGVYFIQARTANGSVQTRRVVLVR